jgi:hypothetical protein
VADLITYPTDGGDGSVSSEARWRKMARLWVPSGTVPGGLAPTLAAGPAINVTAGSAWLDGHYAELAAPTSVPVSANGLLVLRFTPADNRCELLYRDGASTPTQTDPTWELPLAKMVAGAMTDLRLPSMPSGVPVVGALPPFPYDGQTVHYLCASPARLWTLTYSAAAPAPYRWCFTGGAPIHAEVPTAEPSAVSGGWVELPTGGPILPVPLAGLYRFGFGFQGVANTATVSQLNMALCIMPGVAPLTWGAAAISPNTTSPELTATEIEATIGSPCEIRGKYLTMNAAGTYSSRWATMTPVRVG